GSCTARLRFGPPASLIIVSFAMSDGGHCSVPVSGVIMSTAPSVTTRIEKDSIGPKEIPANVYYGVQTARAVENYPISGMRAHPTLIRAIAMIKRAAAEANKELGLLDAKVADAIITAAQEVCDGKWDREFVVDVFQAGAGVSFH